LYISQWKLIRASTATVNIKERESRERRFVRVESVPNFASDVNKSREKKKDDKRQQENGKANSAFTAVR